MGVVFIIIALAWVPFRALTFEDTAYIWTHIFSYRDTHLSTFMGLGLPAIQLGIAFGMIAILTIVEASIAFEPWRIMRMWNYRAFRWPCYVGCAYSIVFFGVFESVQFIYFQF
jgi:hypothetical protein